MKIFSNTFVKQQTVLRIAILTFCYEMTCMSEKGTDAAAAADCAKMLNNGRVSNIFVSPTGQCICQWERRSNLPVLLHQANHADCKNTY
jgi:hypothetical protein